MGLLERPYRTKDAHERQTERRNAPRVPKEKPKEVEETPAFEPPKLELPDAGV